MAQSVKLSVPLLPPSVNHYKAVTRRGRWYVKPEGIAFKAAVAALAGGRTISPETLPDRAKVRYGLKVTVVLGKKARGDGDNFFKCIADGLKDAGVVHSDAKIREWSLSVDELSRPAESRTE
ncbi:MAG: RusA family crossover junction endodeoxyribonuclease, partial [Ktedonobacteraceae bacterium]